MEQTVDSEMWILFSLTRKRHLYGPPVINNFRSKMESTVLAKDYGLHTFKKNTSNRN
jgi:hypothetical protein